MMDSRQDDLEPLRTIDRPAHDQTAAGIEAAVGLEGHAAKARIGRPAAVDGDRPMTALLPPSLFPGPVLRPDWRWGSLAPWGYGLIMADPPWHFENYSAKGEAKGPAAQYRTMTDDDIAALPVADLVAPDCLLWLWATWPKLPLALRCLEAWGARYVTGGAWDKRRWGTGYVLRSVCEPFLIGAWGDPAADGRSVPNLIAESRRRHSEKPEAAYAAAERLLPGVRRVELFSRRARAGWDVWGDEVGELLGAPTDTRPAPPDQVSGRLVGADSTAA